MGKSLGNAIYLSDDEETIRKKVMSAVTDPNKIKKDDPAIPDICMVNYYHKLIKNENIETICNECKQGARGCVQCKKELIEKMMEFLKPIHEKMEYYEAHPEIVDKIFMDSTAKAKKEAEATMRKVKQAININYFE